MSGIEIAGIALGILPIVLQSVDAYKDGIRRVSTTIRKRKYVEKLARALLLQKQILEETARSILLTSGCDEVCALEEDPYAYFCTEDVQEHVEEFLGTKNIVALIELIEVNTKIIRKVAKNLSGLVPEFEKPTDDLEVIIRANKRKERLLSDIVPRVKLLFSVTDIKCAIQELDDGTAALDRFSRLVLSNRQTIQNMSSKKALRLAKALNHIRGYVGGLYVAMLEHFQRECHDNHETTLYLEDRVDAAPTLLKQIGKASHVGPLITFDVGLTVASHSGERKFYEIAVQVFNEEDQEDYFSLYSEPDPKSLPVPQFRSNSEVQFSISRSPSPCRPAFSSVDSLCSAIQDARLSRRRLSFALLGAQKLGAVTGEEESVIQAVEDEPANRISLAEILSEKKVSFPWKFRMLLALRLASNLLQLLQTQWLRRPWSKDVIYFLALPRSTTGRDSGIMPSQVDLKRPFVACAIGSLDAAPSESASVEPRVAMLELGILLLEIWHQTTLEARFGLNEAPGSYYERMARAVEWLDDVDEPLPELYDKAVSHCLRVNIGGDTRFTDWEDIKLWNVICENIIEPLSGICKQWAG